MLIRNHVVQALLDNQQVGGGPKFMEDVYANIKPGKTSYFDLIYGLKDLAEELEMTSLDVRNSLTSSCFRKDFHDKSNPSNPYPFDNIFRAVADTYEGEHGTDEQVDVGGLEETEIDQVPGLASSMASAGIGGVGLSNSITSPFAPMASVDICGVELGDSITSPSAVVRSPFLSPSSRPSRHFTPQGNRSSTHRRHKAALTSGSKRSRDEINTIGSSLSPKSAKRIYNPNYSETYLNHLALMQAEMSKAKVLSSNGIHENKLSFNSGKEKIDSMNPTPLARMLVTDRNGTKKKFKAFSSKTGSDFSGLIQMSEELGKEESHSSMEGLENHVYFGTEHCKLAIKKNMGLIKECVSIKDEAERLSKLNIEEAASEKTKRMQELDGHQAVEMEQLKASQAAARKLKAAGLDKEEKDSISKINSMKDSVVRAVSHQKNCLEHAIKEQEKELKNSFTLERSHVKLVKTGLEGLKRALTEGDVAAKGYLAAVLKMQEAIKLGDPKRMKENILDVEIREDDDEEVN